MTYDPLLVLLSVLIAICGGYTCFHMVDRLTRMTGASWKSTILAAALAIGGGIWSMHFVGMLAMRLPDAISYSLQETLLSALIAIGITAVALYLVTYSTASIRLTMLSGVLFGLGISGMHYVGMAAIRGNYTVSYDAFLVVLSVLIGIGASIMALYLALRVRNKLKQLPAAVAMGLGISAMHYTGMQAASFSISSTAVIAASPVIDNATMGIVITVAAFFLLGSTFFLAAPVPNTPRHAQAAPPGGAGAIADFQASLGQVGARHEAPETRIPVEAGERRTHISAHEIVCVHADSHYTRICSADEEYFCAMSISQIEDKLEPHGLMRVHRSHLVNIHHIKEFNRQKEHGDVIVKAAGSEHKVPVSRGKIELLKVTLVSIQMAGVAE